jgi:cytochrome P450
MMTTLKPAPSPKSRPIIGMIPEMTKDMLGMFMDLTKNHGGIVQFKLLNKTYMLVTKPDYVKHILQSNHHNYIRGRSVETGRVLLGNGLPLSDGDFWLSQRRIIQPAFHRQKLNKISETITSAIQNQLSSWDKYKNHQPFDMEDEMTNLTLSIIIKTMFSAKITDAQVKSLGEEFRIASAFMLWKSQQFVQLPLSVPLPKHIQYNKAAKVLNEIVYPLIAEGRKNPQDDLLGMLLNAKDAETGLGMSDAQLRDEIITIFFAGHETSAMALTWAFYLIAKNKHVESKLIGEITQVLNTRTPTLEDLPKLTYTTQVINEVLRLYPPAYLFAREAVTDQELDGYLIPAGTLIFITPYVTHHDTHYWSDPEIFDPERFIPENISKRDKDIYYPFGAGPHICIGNNLAMMEMQLTLAMIYQRFKPDLMSDSAMGLKPEATLRPKSGMLMKL